MSYDLSNYLPAQQAAIGMLLNKIYEGPPPEVVTEHAFQAPVTATEFNNRIRQLWGLVAYLEDMYRSERARAQIAESTLAARVDALGAGTGVSGVIDEYVGTFSGLNLTLTAGRSLIGATSHLYSDVMNTITFTTLVNQKLVVHTDGHASVEASGYADTPLSLTVGIWDGLAYFPVPNVRVVVQDTVFNADVEIGVSNRDTLIIRAVQVEADTRRRVFTTDGLTGQITQIEEFDGAVLVKTTTFSYDGSGNISSRSQTAAGITVVTSYDYDGSGGVSESERIVI